MLRDCTADAARRLSLAAACMPGQHMRNGVSQAWIDLSCPVRMVRTRLHASPLAAAGWHNFEHVRYSLRAKAAGARISLASHNTHAQHSQHAASALPLVPTASTDMRSAFGHGSTRRAAGLAQDSAAMAACPAPSTPALHAAGGCCHQQLGSTALKQNGQQLPDAEVEVIQQQW
jgi:hypothetical protein